MPLVTPQQSNLATAASEFLSPEAGARCGCGRGCAGRRGDSSPFGSFPRIWNCPPPNVAVLNVVPLAYSKACFGWSTSVSPTTPGDPLGTWPWIGRRRCGCTTRGRAAAPARRRRCARGCGTRTPTPCRRPARRCRGSCSSPRRSPQHSASVVCGSPPAPPRVRQGFQRRRPPSNSSDAGDGAGRRRGRAAHRVASSASNPGVSPPQHRLIARHVAVVLRHVTGLRAASPRRCWTDPRARGEHGRVSLENGVAGIIPL